MRADCRQARESIHRIAGRSGRPASSSTATVDAVVAQATATTGPAPAHRGVASSVRVASQTAAHQSSGSCSAQPGRG